VRRDKKCDEAGLGLGFGVWGESGRVWTGDAGLGGTKNTGRVLGAGCWVLGVLWAGAGEVPGKFIQPRNEVWSLVSPQLIWSLLTLERRWQQARKALRGVRRLGTGQLRIGQLTRIHTVVLITW